MVGRPEISHLTDEQVEELYKRYVAGERNADLVREYKVSVSPNSLIKVFPPVKLDSVFCPCCDLQMYERRKSKSELASGEASGFCTQCEHKYYGFQSPRRGRQCGCAFCLSKLASEKAEADRLVREKIREYWMPRVGSPVPYEKLDVQEKVYLLSLINAQADSNYLLVKSVSERPKDVSLAPSGKMEGEILVLLYRRGLIAVDPESPISGFDHKKVESASVVEVRWIVNIGDDGGLRTPLEDLQRKITQDLMLALVDTDAHEVKTLALSALTEEVMQQVHYQCGRVGLPFNAEKKGREVVGELLHQYSLVAVCYFAYLAVRRAHDYYLNSHVGKLQASNVIPSKMQGYGAKAAGEEWDLSTKRYISSEPRSELCKVIFDLVLRAEDAGRTQKVSSYFRRVARGEGATLVSLVKCPACGSSMVHVSIAGGGMMVDCKDCIAQSSVAFPEVVGLGSR